MWWYIFGLTEYFFEIVFVLVFGLVIFYICQVFFPATNYINSKNKSHFYHLFLRKVTFNNLWHYHGYFSFVLHIFIIWNCHIRTLCWRSFSLQTFTSVFQPQRTVFFSSLSNNFEIAKKVLKNYLNMPTRLSFLEYVCQAFKFYFISFFWLFDEASDAMIFRILKCSRNLPNLRYHLIANWYLVKHFTVLNLL